ncbi:MAG: chaperone modulator CbpM [Ferruginibacter sp.]
MQTDEMIQVNEFCMHHQIEISFIQSLQQSGLIEVIQTEEKLCVPRDQLPELEKMVRLYYEMDINLEGIETISYLLNRMNAMQQEIIQLNNRLQAYEENQA